MVERLGRLTTKKRNSVRSQKRSLSDPALQGRMFQYSDDVVDEAKPEEVVGGWLSENLCGEVNGYSIA